MTNLQTTNWKSLAGCFTLVWATLFLIIQIGGRNSDFQFTMLILHLIWWRMESLNENNNKQL